MSNIEATGHDATSRAPSVEALHAVSPRRGITIALAILLCVAAALKTQSLYRGSAPAPGGISYLATPLAQTLIIEFEIVLAVWLFSGWQPALAWYTALPVFAVYAAFSAFMVATGVKRCNCLGILNAPPWLMLVVDLLAVGLLWRYRPPLAVSRVAGRFALGVAVAGAAGLLMAYLVIGPVHDLLLRSEGFLLVPPTEISTVSLSPAANNGTASFALRNISSEEVRVVGIHPTCACIQATNLPLRIAPGETCSLEVAIVEGCGKTNLPTDVNHALYLFLDRQSARIHMGLQLHCTPD